jgi:hypothetical protein
MLSNVIIYLLRCHVTEVYSDALKKAEKELAEADAAAGELDRKRAKLRLTVAALQSMTGVKVKSDQTLTDAILMIVKGSPGAVTATEVMDKLFMLGLQAQTASVATILSRLAKVGKIICLRDPGGSSLLGYEWKTPRTKSEMLTANKAVAEMSKRGKQ